MKFNQAVFLRWIATNIAASVIAFALLEFWRMWPQMQSAEYRWALIRYSVLSLVLLVAIAVTQPAVCCSADAFLQGADRILRGMIVISLGILVAIVLPMAALLALLVNAMFLGAAVFLITAIIFGLRLTLAPTTAAPQPAPGAKR